MEMFKWYRKLKGGTWYKYVFKSQIPLYGSYGSYWSKTKFEPHPCYEIVLTETY